MRRREEGAILARALGEGIVAVSVSEWSRPLDKGSFEPLYAQMQRRLEEEIRSGRLGVDDALPGEAELSRMFGVSRMTSRQALQGLTAEGFAYRERGRGTFVRAPKVEKQIAHLLGFSAEMRLLGLKATTRVLGMGTVAAPPHIAESLGLALGAEVTMLHRLRLADGEPIAIEQVWLPRERFAGIEGVDFARCSLYETLRERYGVRVGSAEETIEARGASKDEAGLLGVAAKASLLVVSRVLLDVEGRPVEVAHSVYRGDRYRAVLTIPAVEGERMDGRRAYAG